MYYSKTFSLSLPVYSPPFSLDTVVKKLSRKLVDVLNSAQEDGGKEGDKGSVTVNNISSNSESHHYPLTGVHWGGGGQDVHVQCILTYPNPFG